MSNTENDFRTPKLSYKFIETGGLMIDYRHEATPISIHNYNDIEDVHFHNYCELYYNISGNVRFMVENHIYNVSKGDIIITKPNEFHKCLFDEDCIHEHICIWFDATAISPVLEPLLNRELGQQNMIVLPDKEKTLFLLLCLEFEKNKNDTTKQIKNLSIILQILALVEEYSKVENSKKFFLPELVYKALNFINKNFNSISSIKQVSDKFSVSQSTLDRNFKKHFNISPKRYMETKRILYARQLLEQGKSVTDACFDSGFNDCSHFIATFKKYFKTTPNQVRIKNKKKLKMKNIKNL